MGGTLGEMTGYLLGYAGRAAIENLSLYQRMEYRMKKWGLITLFAFAGACGMEFILRFFG